MDNFEVLSNKRTRSRGPSVFTSLDTSCLSKSSSVVCFFSLCPRSPSVCLSLCCFWRFYRAFVAWGCPLKCGNLTLPHSVCGLLLSFQSISPIWPLTCKCIHGLYADMNKLRHMANWPFHFSLSLLPRYFLCLFHIFHSLCCSWSWFPPLV